MLANIRGNLRTQGRALFCWWGVPPSRTKFGGLGADTLGFKRKAKLGRKQTSDFPSDSVVGVSLFGGLEGNQEEKLKFGSSPKKRHTWNWTKGLLRWSVFPRPDRPITCPWNTTESLKRALVGFHVRWWEGNSNQMGKQD